MKFLPLLLLPVFLSAQMREDLFEDIDMKTILTPLEHVSYLENEGIDPLTLTYHYLLFKRVEATEELKITKSTSICLVLRGKLQAYNDIINYIER
jgi:hypothetical protein